MYTFVSHRIYDEGLSHSLDDFFFFFYTFWLYVNTKCTFVSKNRVGGDKNQKKKRSARSGIRTHAPIRVPEHPEDLELEASYRLSLAP
uniref:Uncharacterized protein n=1 Tax=Caenorhabditis japonica TaxID=281687 RepID=A0A8R1ECK5_CAEJA